MVTFQCYKLFRDPRCAGPSSCSETRVGAVQYCTFGECATRASPARHASEIRIGGAPQWPPAPSPQPQPPPQPHSVRLGPPLSLDRGDRWTLGPLKLLGRGDGWSLGRLTSVERGGRWTLPRSTGAVEGALDLETPSTGATQEQELERALGTIRD